MGQSLARNNYQLHGGMSRSKVLVTFDDCPCSDIVHVKTCCCDCSVSIYGRKPLHYSKEYIRSSSAYLFYVTCGANVAQLYWRNGPVKHDWLAWGGVVKIVPCFQSQRCNRVLILYIRVVFQYFWNDMGYNSTIRRWRTYYWNGERSVLVEKMDRTIRTGWSK